MVFKYLEAVIKVLILCLGKLRNGLRILKEELNEETKC